MSGLPSRNLTAAQVAKATGRGARMVQMWASSQACPCDWRTENNVRSPRFDLDEVKAWLKAKGLPLTKSMSGPDAAASKRDDDDGGAVGSIFAEIWKDAAGQVDFDRIIADATYTLRDIRRNAESDVSSAEAQQLASALKQASAEIRQLEVARFEKQKRDREWVRRDVAQELLTGEASIFVAELEGLAQDLPDQIIAALGGVLSSEQTDATRRLLSVAVRGVVDRLRARRADSIDRAVGVLAHEGGRAA